MRPLLTNALLPLALLPGVTVLAHSVEHGDFSLNSTSTTFKCKAIEHLSTFVDIANNETALEDKFEGDATRIEEFQARASEAAETLSTLQANETLVTICNQRAAVEEMESQCRLQSTLEKIINATESSSSSRLRARRHHHGGELGGAVSGRGISKRIISLGSSSSSDGNQDADFHILLHSRRHRGGDGNGTRTIDVDAAQETLDSLSSNSTLQQFCAARATAQDCREMARLENIVSLAGNDSILAHSSGAVANAFEHTVEAAQAQLDELRANETLVAVCEDSSNTNTTVAAEASGDSATGVAHASFDLATPSTMVGIVAFWVFIIIAL